MMIIAAREPIGRLITLAHLEKGLLAQQPIALDVATLVDLITVRVKDRPVAEVAESLQKFVFDLRLHLLEWLAQDEKGIHFYIEALNKHVSVNLQLAPFSELAATVSSVLLAYEKIVSPALAHLPTLLGEVANNATHPKPQYDTFKFLSQHPSPPIRALKDWMDASLQLEVGLVLSDLVLTGQIEFPTERIAQELITFLNRVITRFGAHSIFTGFWEPDHADVSHLTNRMKILCATIELNNRISHPTSKEGLAKVLNA